jgi:3',5'-cyclic AMP phosphodiesterase CpdA
MISGRPAEGRLVEGRLVEGRLVEGRPVEGRPVEGVVIAHLSDLHLGADDPVAVDGLARDVAATRPLLTVVSGDLTMRARTGQFRRAAALLDSLPDPVLVVAGNHDLPLVSPLRLLHPYGRYRRWIDADPSPVLRVPGITAVGLQSMPRWRWKNGRVSPGQAHAVIRILATAPTGDVRLLALHHPPSQLLGRSRLLRAVDAACADLVLSGHTHVPSVRPLSRAVLVVAGTATSRRTRGAAVSWSSIIVGGDGIVVRERYLANGGWRTGRTVHCPLPYASATSCPWTTTA